MKRPLKPVNILRRLREMYLRCDNATDTRTLDSAIVYIEQAERLAARDSFRFMAVDYIDGNPRNRDLSNMRLVTLAENAGGKRQ